MTLAPHVHPLLPLSAEEIERATSIVKRRHDETAAISFRAVQLQEPKKAELIPYLAAEHAGRLGSLTERPPRRARVQYFVKTGRVSRVAECIVDVETGKEVEHRIFDPDVSIGMSM
jgi:primary-amine oxidase